jgi:hypothetical protein
MNAPCCIEYQRPTLYTKQFAAIYDPHRYSLIEASTKAGKTSGCIAWIVEQALTGHEGMNYWWVAPVSDQALIAFRRMKRSLPHNVYTANISLKTITLLNGAIIWFKSGDKPDSLYGEDVYAVVLDEASRMKEEAYIAIRTTLTYTRGPVRIIGNVRGKKNWFYQMARRAERETMIGTEPREMSYHKIVAHDAVEAGVLDAKEIEDARGQMPEQWFRELYFAEASDDGGNPFGQQHIDACTRPDIGGGVCSDKPVRAWGWDFAKRQDFTVGIGLDADGAVAKFVRYQGVPWGDVVNRVVAESGATPALGDSTGVGDPIVEDIQRRIAGTVTDGCSFQGYHFTPASKQKLMEGLALAVQTRTVWFPPGIIKAELEQFEFTISPSGVVRYSAPQGYHDDCVCALALARMCFSIVPAPMQVSQDLIRRVMALPKRRRYG